ncbi:MAG: DUF742 domain-containing protein [Frankiaceae bacterium]|jgi:hypothetical protein|nr:DUF742 domain-containing protein [Frankiaceae bacterium]
MVAANDEPGPEPATVRPYVLTGGRVGRPAAELPLETLVTATFQADTDAESATPEMRTIVALAVGRFISLAELSAHAKLPLGVIRVLVSDLVDANLLSQVGTPTSGPRRAGGTGYTHQSPSLAILEDVLDGVSSL